MNANDQLYAALERFQQIARKPTETPFERAIRNMREAKLARESAEYRGPDSATSCDDNDWS